jgi:signal transduction histidine kinase/ActR/RegA family two-component response regulator
MAQSPTQDTTSPLAWRFVTGKVFSESKGVVHLDVDIIHPQKIKTVRLAVDPQQIAHYPHGAFIKLFIAQPSHGQDQNNLPLWHVADGAMAEPAQNPWMLGQVRNGDVIEGVVSGYVGNYAVIIDLTHNLTQELIWHDLKEFTAFLHIKNTPNAGLSRNIRQLLHVGDCVQAVITKADLEEINIDLSVKEWLDIRRQELEQQPEQNAQRRPLLQTVITPPIAREEKTLLLIDDDKQFCSEMQKQLRHWQIKVRFCHNLQGLKKELAQQKFDACLMDCNLGLADKEQNAMLGLLKFTQDQHPWLRFARMTGDEASMQQGHQQLLLKPLNISQLLTWLDDGEIPAINFSQRRLLFKNNGQHWQAQGAEAFVVERARRLLQCCCEEIYADKALWIREERSGYFAIRVAYRIEEAICRKLEKDLQITRIATAIEGGETLEVVDYKSGLLHDTLGDFGNVFIMPFKSNGKCDRAVAFFSNKPFTEQAKKYLHAQQDHLEDMTYLMDTTLALEANETFATQGMLLSSTVHEFRTAASIVAGISQRLRELLNRPIVLVSDSDLREEISSMVNASERLVELSEKGLDRIRPEQQTIEDLQQLLSNILDLMRGRMYTLSIKATLAPLNCAIDYPIPLPYPPKYVELPLINLLDNALLHCKARSWAKVEVTLSLDPSHPELPILIQVDDSGLGMTAEQRNHLFTARKTGRGIAGSGMGLFLSKQLLEAIGGHIELAKTVRWLGSRFNIRLPSAS